MNKEKYGLFTAVTMIVGIVIGSGIFFKSDDILIFTDGSIALGVLVFCLSAIAIIFGCLSLSELASRTDKPGGIITYAEEFCSNKVACAFGWFQTFIYYPTLTAVVAWVAGIYTFMLFGIDAGLLEQVLLGAVFILFIYAVNILSAKLGGWVQNAATIIKMIPLILIAVAGFFFGEPSLIMSTTTMENAKSLLWIAAVGPIAFSFDGWVVATSISHEIKNAKRNLPLAMVLAPVCILAVYVLYFVGISILVGPAQIMEMRNAHVDFAANQIFGASGAKIILIFVVISVLGTVNGLVLGNIRMPYSLAIRGMIPMSKALSQENEKLSIPVKSAYFSLILSMLWMVAHYITQNNNLLPNSDISEISIVVSYVAYIVLYLKVFGMGKSGAIPGFIRGRVNPVMAIIGSLIILWGGMQNPLFFYYVAVCLLVILISQLYYGAVTKDAK